MNKAALDKCQELIGYRFRDPDILSLALTHASVASTRTESNERQEFLGDTVLALVVCHELYSRPEELLEGDMTKVKSLVVSGKTCAALADKVGLMQVVSLGKGMTGRGSPPESVAAALLEAIIGAIYLDGGLEPARDFLLPRVRPHIDAAMESDHLYNYKSILQQHLQQAQGRRPEYQLLDEKGPDHSKCFEVAVCIGGRHFQPTWGTTKKEAEQSAARQALLELGVLTEEGPAEPTDTESAE